jgi:hypothetical protein
MVSEEKALSIKRRHSRPLLRIPWVCAVGIECDENGGYILVIHTETDDPELIKDLPDSIDGCPVKVTHSGPFLRI